MSEWASKAVYWVYTVTINKINLFFNIKLNWWSVLFNLKKVSFHQCSTHDPSFLSHNQRVIILMTSTTNQIFFVVCDIRYYKTTLIGFNYV